MSDIVAEINRLVEPHGLQFCHSDDPSRAALRIAQKLYEKTEMTATECIKAQDQVFQRIVELFLQPIVQAYYNQVMHEAKIEEEKETQEQDSQGSENAQVSDACGKGQEEGKKQAEV